MPFFVFSSDQVIIIFPCYITGKNSLPGIIGGFRYKENFTPVAERRTFFGYNMPSPELFLRTSAPLFSNNKKEHFYWILPHTATFLSLI